MNHRPATSRAFVRVQDVDIAGCGITLQTTPEGRLQATRSRKEKEKSPDRISLDRRGLTQLPVLIGEPRLRLLSLQHNLLSRLDGLGNLGLTRLVFLDLYDNQLERLTALDTLENLRVLLVGKNRIRRIEGLNMLFKLEVLDLHGNQIYQVGGLSSQKDLKVLNLAGNQIRVIGTSDLVGLRSLQELNLRRNRIKRLLGFAETPQLQKLFLSNNELLSVENMTSIVQATQLREITIDNNPVSLGGDCVSYLVSHLPHLKLLSRMEVTSAVRDAAMAWRNASSGPRSEQSSAEVRREEVISNARTNWELLRSQTHSTSTTSLASSQKDFQSDLELDTHCSDRLVQSDSGVGSTSSSVNCRVSVRCASTKPTHVSAEVRRLNFARRNISRESNCSQTTISSTTSVTSDPFKLPPILAALASNQNSSVQNEPSSNEVCQDFQRCDSSSSVEPNVDSSLSSLDSDSNESSTENEEVESSEDLPETELPKKEVTRNIKSAVHYRRTAPRRLQNRPTTGKPHQKVSACSEKVHEQGGDYLIEIRGRSLNVYGQAALRYVDRAWNSVEASNVDTVKFNYVDFNSMLSVFGHMKQRFPNAENFVFRENNITCLGQLNALADIQGISSLTIEPEGNPITSKEWEMYAIYRLRHWGLKIINGREITEEEVAAASEEFQGLSDIVLWSLPDSLLQPLLHRLQLEGDRNNPSASAKQWLCSVDPALRSVVCKEALQWRRAPTQEDIMIRHKGKHHLGKVIDLAFEAVEKLTMLEAQWPSILLEIIQETLVDYSHMDTYMKQCMKDLKL